VIPVHLPALKDRIEDLPLLVKHFLDKYKAGSPSKVEGFSKGALSVLMHYAWPGNVRELENLVERMAVLCDDPEVGIGDLPDKILAGSSSVSTKSNWVKNRAAKLLHLNRTTLVEKIKKQNLEKPTEINIV